MFHKLSKAYTVAELSATTYGKECYKRKIFVTCMVWNKTTETFHEMTEEEDARINDYRVVGIRHQTDEDIYYGVML